MSKIDREYAKERRQAIREDRKYQRSLRKEEKAKKAQERSARSNQNRQTFDIIKLVGGLMLGLSLVFVLTDPQRDLSLFGLLDFFSNSPTLDVANVQFVNDLTITANWQFFNFLRDFINLFTGMLQFIANLGTILWNTIVYFWYFVRWLYVG